MARTEERPEIIAVACLIIIYALICTKEGRKRIAETIETLGRNDNGEKKQLR